jgi:hypothetical protein
VVADDLAVVPPMMPRMMPFVALSGPFRVNLRCRMDGRLGRCGLRLVWCRLQLRRDRGDGYENQEQGEHHRSGGRTHAPTEF